ncbi:hypothetical protein P154DRAFT_568913 [Amniculicola lignicola CBS 123094]|uniref:Condensation domain-containing protein n=1 Tax=Amniculicola lignicola CBS 123094 TaxID=1392246 RepID=A0A6A5X553_9PLEO|nr:hypothetical protein P154DRAFT_568913 [Amniculicola lignicola CBS 123094]
MLVSRVGVSRSQSVLHGFQEVQNNFIQSLPHQHCSLAQFQHHLGLSGKPLFNTSVSIQNHGAVESQSPQTPSIKFEHTHAFDPIEFAITINIDASCNDEGTLFSPWTDSISDDEMKNVSSTMAKILSQVITDSTQTISELDAPI